MLAIANSTVADLSRVAYVPLAMVGLLLYYIHIERHLRKDLIKGVPLVIISEFVFPVLAKI